MKRRIAVLLCVLLCAFGLAACSSSDDSGVKEEIVTSLETGTSSMINQITSMDDETLQKYIESYTENSEYAGVLSGLESWRDSREELGALTSIDSTSVKYDNTNKLYIANVKATFEKRTGVVSFAVNKDNSIKSIAFNPDYTFGEKMAKAGMNTLMGLAVVFVILIGISLIIYCFNFIHAAEERAKAGKQAQAPVQEAAAPAAASAEEEEEDLTDDLELVAVVAAAIAASEGTSPNGLVVRSIRRAGRPNWKNA